MTGNDSAQKIHRYRGQSLRLLERAFNEMRGGRWSRTEDLLWGSLTLAIKAVSLHRGNPVAEDAEVRAYAQALGRELRDRRVQEAFNQLTVFSETLDLVRDSRSRVDYLFLTLDDVSSAVERLWELVPPRGTDERPTGIN